MTAEELGLVEGRPDRGQIGAAVVIGLLLALGGICTRVLGDLPLYKLPVIVVVVDAILLVSDLVTAALLFAQAAMFRSRALMALAAGYLLTALMTIPHALTFPGAFALNGLLGGPPSSTAWLAIFWRAELPLAVGAYALLKRNNSLYFRRPSSAVATSVSVAAVLALSISVLAIRGGSLLPSLISASSAWNYSNLYSSVVPVLALSLGAILILLRELKSRLDVWLILSLAASSMNVLLIAVTSGRFTLAWYYAYGLMAVSQVTVALALIAEASRSYAQLTLLLLARDRERDARQMSMDAVAAAIAHEIGQPLGAIVTNASAGLRWLDRVPPDLDMVSQSLKSNIEQGHRASHLMGSIRAVLAKRSGERTSFNINELVRETSSLLDREMAAASICLQLDLDEAVPSITADRVQIQQVLVNLLTNAVQSLRTIRQRPRKIVIRSAPADGQDVVLHVADNGAGIAPEKLDHIFDAFFTTKRRGTGIGLSLCRTIVDQHGGRLWASLDAENGVTFHLQLHAEPFARP